jgi:hypothetical protein
MLSLRSWFTHVVAFCQCIATACFAVANHFASARGLISGLNSTVDSPSSKDADNPKEDRPDMAIKTKIITDAIRMSDHMSGTVIRAGKVVGFSESLREGRAASGDAQPAGTLDYQFVGPTPKGEQGTLETCRVLVRAMNGAQPTWREPDTLSDLTHVDCRAPRLDGQAPPLDIQVVRALANSAFWQKVGRHGRGDGVSVSPQELAQHLRSAIELKVGRIPTPVRSTLVLALSALDSPVVAFDSVVDAFRIRSEPWAKAQGFLSIWLVGPNVLLTHQLV